LPAPRRDRDAVPEGARHPLPARPRRHLPVVLLSELRAELPVQTGVARSGTVLSRVRTDDGALGEGAADPDARVALRGTDGRPGVGDAAAARLLRPGAGRALSALHRGRALREDGQHPAGAAADVPQLGRPLAALREAPATAARGAVRVRASNVSEGLP